MLAESCTEMVQESMQQEVSSTCKDARQRTSNKTGVCSMVFLVNNSDGRTILIRRLIIYEEIKRLEAVPEIPYEGKG